MAIQFNTNGLIGSIDIGSSNSEGWRTCHISVSALGFSAEYDCDIAESEWRSLLNDLETAYQNLGQNYIIEFRALEHGVSLKLKLDRRGHIDGSYEFARDWRGPRLSGSFSADQTHLVAWSEELKAALNNESA
ncbi:MAG TPA: hypothetical protein VGZ47_22685 [Gemmataceae bacterium]|nr:hypothetical protein [Gemmataceae bacterium]